MALHLLLALSRHFCDLATPLLAGLTVAASPIAALALGLHPSRWLLALWEPEEECTAPAWPDVASAVALLAARGCTTVRTALPLPDQFRTAAQLDRVEIKTVDKIPLFRLMTLDEIKKAAREYLGEELEASAQPVSIKYLLERPLATAAVVLGALRPTAAGIYMPEPQLLLLATK